jgi:hypothetical protein
MEDEMLTEKMIEQIDIKVDRYFERFYHGHYVEMRELEHNIKECSGDIFANQKRITDRMDEIEKIIRAHAVGMQNVYEEVKIIKNMYNVSIIDTELLDKIQRIKIVLEE